MWRISKVFHLSLSLSHKYVVQFSLSSLELCFSKSSISLDIAALYQEKISQGLTVDIQVTTDKNETNPKIHQFTPSILIQEKVEVKPEGKEGNNCQCHFGGICLCAMVRPPRKPKSKQEIPNDLQQLFPVDSHLTACSCSATCSCSSGECKCAQISSDCPLPSSSLFQTSSSCCGTSSNTPILPNNQTSSSCCGTSSNALGSREELLEPDSSEYSAIQQLLFISQIDNTF